MARGPVCGMEVDPHEMLTVFAMERKRWCLIQPLFPHIGITVYEDGRQRTDRRVAIVHKVYAPIL